MIQCRQIKDCKFQSTRPRGRTRLAFIPIVVEYIVSIHASSREDATKVILFSKTLHVFQSTRPRGRTRPQNVVTLTLIFCFNPRVLAGGRDFLL